MPEDLIEKRKAAAAKVPDRMRDGDSAAADASDVSGYMPPESRQPAAACPCCHPAERHKERTDKEYRDLIMRLNRIEGQIRGIRGMVEDSAYCIDILTQVSAATSALNSFSKVLLQSHIKSCVADDIRGGSGEKLDELIRFLPKMMK